MSRITCFERKQRNAMNPQAKIGKNECVEIYAISQHEETGNFKLNLLNHISLLNFNSTTNFPHLRLPTFD